MSVITDLIDENSSCNARIAELEQDLAYFPSTVRSLAETVTEREAEINHLRAELAAIKAQEPIGWYTEDHLDDKSATTYSWTVAERWVEKGWPVSPLYAAPVSEAKAQGVVQWPEADEIMQMAFEEGQPADDASGYCFELEEFDLFIERLMSEVSRLNAAPAAPAADAGLVAVEWAKDAEEWGPALNEAGWLFLSELNEDPQKSALIFNNTKGPLRAAIMKYAEIVTAHRAKGVV